MLLKAMNNFQVAKRDYDEAKKAQYTDMKGEDGSKNYFRASELGYSDRKIVYGFFKHQIPTVPKSAKNLRQLENGDGVHARYQKAWDDMGALISMEERLTSKDDEYLKQFPWEWAGHYDGYLDMNVLKAHALGKCTIGYTKNEQGDWEMEVSIDDAYAEELGIFKEDYEPLGMVADIKTMNPWGFKRVAQGNLSEIQGYVDQISFYMYMLNTPYGSIFIEDKGSNDLVEVQIVWKDLHEGVEYSFDPEIHGAVEDGILRVVIDNERFFGSDKVLGLVPRLSHLWETVVAIKDADQKGASTDMTGLIPPRCSEDPAKFPCSWGDGKEKCEYFEHCWNQYHHGLSVRPYEACPAECIWEIVDKTTGEIYKVDSRKFPEGLVTKEAVTALFDIRAITLGKFLVDDKPSIPATEAEDDAVNADNILNASGELNLGNPPATITGEEVSAASETPPAPSEALEYKTDNGEKAIKCLNCQKEITYQKLAAGNTKKCPFCGNVNRVTR